MVKVGASVVKPKSDHLRPIVGIEVFGKQVKHINLATIFLPIMVRLFSRSTCRQNLLPLCPTVAVLVGPLLGISHFWVNDDVGNLLWVSGGFSGSPEYLNPVLGPILGLLVSELYRVTDIFAWYPITILAVPAVASYMLLRKLTPKLATTDHVLITVFVSAGMLLLGIKINYTFSSFVSCSLSVILLLLNATTENFRLRQIIMPFFLCLLSLSLRVNWSTTSPIVPPAFLFVAVAALSGSVFLSAERRNIALLRFGALLAMVYLVAWIPQIVIILLDSQWANFIDFYSARGSLNGVSTLDTYLNSVSPNEVFIRTGMDEAALWELTNWSLFDAQSVPTDHLLALAQEISDLRKRLIMSDTLGVGRGNLLSFLRNLSWFIAAACFMMFAQGRRIITFHQRLSMLSVLSLVLSTSALVVLATAGLRYPEYVMAGTVFSVALILILAGTFQAQVKPQLSVRYRAPQLIAIVLVALGCWLNFGERAWWEFENNPNAPDESGYRKTLQYSTRLDKPVIHDLMLVGNAYQTVPFDRTVPMEYLHSMNFGGGSNVRSPQYLRRWNFITGENQNAESLFNSQFYSRVYFTSNVYIRLLVLRENCSSLKMTDAGVFQKSKSCGPLFSLADVHREIDLWWSKPAGFRFLVLRDIKQMSLNLLSPFGEHAVPHPVNIEVFDDAMTPKSRSSTTVMPVVGASVQLQHLNQGDLISITSSGPCVVPFIIDQNRYPDRRQLCVGLREIVVNGGIVPLESM